MRVVFDTNVLLAGVFTRGLCESLLDVCLGSEKHTVVLSDHILREFTRAAIEKFGVPAPEARQAADLLRAQAQLVEPVEVPIAACRDAADLPVLGTAAAAGADYLVTGDRDLLDLKEFRGIPIVSPRALHQRLV